MESHIRSDAELARKRRGRYAEARVAVVLLFALALQACGCVAYSNRLLVGHCPPPALQLARDLEPKPYGKVSCLARLVGFATTPLKRLGILGWRDMGMDVIAVGDVQQAVFSTDHFLTVDLRLLDLIAGGQVIDLSPARYLRAEICVRQLELPQARWPSEGGKARISGRLMWDGDGFLEVHPLRASDVEILNP